MKKIVIIGGLAESLINFRGSLLAEMASQGFEIHACAPAAPQQVQEKLTALGAHYYDIPLSRTGINPIHDFLTVRAIYQLLRSVRPDFVLSYTIKPVIYGSLAARFARVPGIFSIITGVGYLFSTKGAKPWLAGKVASFLYRAALRHNRRIFFQNPDDRDLFLSLKLIKSEQVVIVNGSGVDTDYFQRVSLPVCPAFLLIARLLNDKGIHEYVEAARVLKRTFPMATFALAGWLDENPACIKHAELQSWIDEGLINYLGRLDDVRPALAASSVYVLPSYREGTPRTVLEAMAMGRPIVTTDAPGCRETVKDGDNGYLVPVKDATALAAAMEKFILQPELIERMGRRSREIAEEKYDVHKVNSVIMHHMGLSNETCI
ncbi:glycosyltransferase family 4 protein [Geomobilimonas luticola]|uniref:Glycosyltransferase family 4 protein n=1 Tax=Geomobilimonas luticola TaxID=1114878 RepID=A0ABS5SCM5_9BACT|nr:glycosyltransferase family 4 protein [Geomobilimonas luticola]MBT0653122.1 glycosyltransferase family 4 protein [Geomobilimonas luticola]